MTSLTQLTDQEIREATDQELASFGTAAKSGAFIASQMGRAKEYFQYERLQERIWKEQDRRK